MRDAIGKGPKVNESTDDIKIGVDWMGWIRVLFVLFSVLSNLLEKLMAEQKPQDRLNPVKEGDQPLPPALPFPPFPDG